MPSGIWHPDEYAKLPAYDRDTWAQPAAVFFCHQDDGAVCSGWLGHADPGDLLAVRIGVTTGELAPECATYRTTVPLWPSGAAAAEHGCRDVEHPDAKACAAIAKISRTRGWAT